MTDRVRYRGASDAELEDLVRGLPRREPMGTLRVRVLSQADARKPRRPRLLTQAVAAAALGALLLSDMAVVARQDRQLAMAGVTRLPVVAARPEPAPSPDAVWLRELSGADGRLALAMLAAPQGEQRDSYRALLREVLENGTGG